jgi:hypothetical protein
MEREAVLQPRTLVQPRIVEAALTGGAIAGVLDISDALIVSYLRAGTPPAQVLHYIASGVLGAAAHTGGVPTAALGLALHFFIAFTAATIYALASTRLPALVRQPFLWGPAYGLVVYVFMREVVLRSAGFTLNTPTTFSLTNQLLIHMLGVGLPIAYFTSRVARAGRT